jgi:hypothetical protein
VSLLHAVRYGSPSFIIPGAQKCGTTALAKYLARHPRLTLARQKEPDHFSRDARYECGAAAYRRQFPKRHPLSRELFYEASVSYSFESAAPERLAAFDPSLRFVFMVREPAARAYSAWNHYRTLATIPSERKRLEAWLSDHNPHERDAGLALLSRPYPSFADAVAAELDAAAGDGPVWTLPALVAGGLYGTQLARLLRHFSREQVLVLEDRELSGQPGATLNRVLAFLGLPAFDWGHEFPPAFVGRYEAAADESTLARLRAFYAAHQRRFFELAGRDFDWPEG